MRRFVLLLAVGALAVPLALSGCAAQSRSSYTVDAIFDSTNGLITQNNVMIAGAKVGTVTGITLTPGYRARVRMQIAGRYAPFHADARCQIRPVALIGEMEVNCDPGTVGSGRLRPTRGEPPTVQVSMTTIPVDLTDLFDIWSSPVSQRLSTVLWTLGAGLAGRGEDLNSVLERSNPTLMLARQVITTLDGQRAQLQEMIDSSDRVLGQLAPARGTVQQFLQHAAAVAALTASHSGALAESVRRLPALLAAAQPALAELDAVSTGATPVLRNLAAAAPNVNALVSELVPLSAAARPVVRRLGSVASAGLRALPSLLPLGSELRTFTRDAVPVARMLSLLFVSMRESGFVEGLNDFPYYVGATLARFDQTSHLAASNFLFTGCGGSSESQYSACSAKYHPSASDSADAIAHARALSGLLRYLVK